MVRDTGEEPEGIRISVRTAMEVVGNKDHFGCGNALGGPLAACRRELISK
jgi:hypothetical protein